VRPEVLAEAKRRAELRVMNETLIQLKRYVPGIKANTTIIILYIYSANWPGLNKP
jgi:hypothetical protein